ncbi:tyrosine-type recombinase/integrase [Rubrivirga sp. IMCC43871]|uniref:tyrosine-type recombinase/integrase n=1 Tax=Rubrivirga sp. IMCC43871 TaxID=3391575 RepID=UPI00399005B6
MPDTPLRLTVAQLQSRLDGFVTDYLKEKSAETKGTYRRALNEFERYHAARAARPSSRFRFVEAEVEAYKAYLMEERELSQVSVSTYLTALRRLCDYLVALGELPENPARGVKGNRRPGAHTRGVLTEAEVETLLGTVPKATEIGRRDRALVSLMVYGGLSEIELVRADVGDVDRTLMGTFLRVQGKGRQSKDEAVPLDGDALDPLEIYLLRREEAGPDAPLFVSHGHRSVGTRLNTRSVRGRVNGYLRAAGVKRRGISPHSLTHTAALIWLNSGMPVEEVRRRMRHGTLETTMISFKKQGLLKPGAGE